MSDQTLQPWAPRPNTDPKGGGVARPSLWSRIAPPLTTLAILAVLAKMAVDVGFSPAQMANGFSRLARVVGAMVPPSSGGQLMHILWALGQTLAMAFVGTIVAALLALPLGILGAKTVVPQPVLHFAFRRCLDLFRGVPALVWALVLVSAFGLGPFAGVCALALADIPHLAKLFAEAIENADGKPIEGVRSTGVVPLAAIRFGLLPQVAPVIASQCLFYLEANFRHAAVLGIVGAGGIGFELEERIRVFSFDTASFIIILYMIAVAALDTISRALRKQLA
jgi:phosphonate transport system permease protein